ncbi:MAG TPA: hypothetical protein VM840_05795, partial [Actinomycetota bacterium]|nr:hypothetical protein [Actinomycetota bacterium]
MTVRLRPFSSWLVLGLLASLLVATGSVSRAALGRVIVEDTFESLADAPGAAPANWRILTIPPFNDNHGTRWTVANNSAGSAFVDGGQTKSLSWDDVASRTGDAFNPDGSTRDDFPLGVVYRTPATAADQPGRVGTYTISAATRITDVGHARLTQNGEPLRLTEDGETFLITYGSVVGALLWPPPATESQPCPEGFGQPTDECRPAAAIAGGVILVDPGNGFDDDPSDDRVEVGALYVSGFVNQTDVTRSGFADTIVPVRVRTSLTRADLFGRTHRVELFVDSNKHLGLRMNGVFYGWGEVANPDGSPLLVPLSKLTSYGMAGVVRNHTRFDNFKAQAGLPSELPPANPTPTPSA